MERLPLLVGCHDDPWIAGTGNAVNHPEFLHRVELLAHRLPDRRYAIVLPHAREEFLVGFCAALVRGQTALFPANETDRSIIELAELYPDSYVMWDTRRPLSIAGVRVSDLIAGETGSSQDVPLVASNHVVAVIQTSGSTGAPRLHEKTWGQMVAGARRWSTRFAITSSDYIVATVPPQHMYGFESTIMLPLQTGAAIFSGRPVFPVDLAAALEHGDGQATLMTTPTHLQVCERSEIKWPPIRQVISSTASLNVELAGAAERRLNTTIVEIYGSTETGAVAARRTTETEYWSCLNGLAIEEQESAVYLRESASGPQLRLADELRIVDDRTFELHGRPSDMLKIAGKRASLSDLNLRLKAIDGVIDGILVSRPDGPRGTERLVALVVAPGLKRSQIRAALATQVDPVFLPRRIFHVRELPRNATGKLTLEATKALLEQLLEESA
jgi:acyl-coenzyme A synthetase/AMP-(fatty) acid ligase